MKAVAMWMLLGMTIGAAGGAPARAQPADAAGQPGAAPSVTGDDDRPWNKGVPLAARVAARQRFLEGNRLFRVPVFTRAAEQYTAALAGWPHPAFYFNLALAQLNLGQQVEARDNLERALQHGGEPLSARERQEARDQLDYLTRQLGQLHIECSTPGAEVTLDGVTLFVGPGSHRGWVTAQPHELTAKRSGYLSVARRIAISPGQREDIELRLITLAEATNRSRRWEAWKPWAVIAAGGAVAAGGGVVHALAAKNFRAFDRELRDLDCVTAIDPTAGCTAEEIPAPMNQRLVHARRQQTLAVGSYIAGGSLVGAGLVLLYLNRPRLTEVRSRRSPIAGLAITPVVSGSTVGVSLTAVR